MYLLFRNQDKNKKELSKFIKCLELKWNLYVAFIWVCEITYIGTDSLTGTGMAYIGVIHNGRDLKLPAGSLAINTLL